MAIEDRKIRLTLKPKHLMDVLSIKEWNELVSRYENDKNVIVHEHMDDFISFDTTLENVVNNHSILDLRFVSWVQELDNTKISAG